MPPGLDDKGGISRIDRGNMLGAVDRFPDQLVEAAHFSVNLDTPKAPIENVVFVGMGGSASAADVLSNWLRDRIGMPVSIVREPILPKFVGSNTLLLAISYSGETRETLAAFAEAGKRGCARAAVTSGGRLKAVCSRGRFPVLQVSGGLVPRAALSQMVGAGAVMLQGFGIARNTQRELLETGRELTTLRGILQVEVPTSRNPAKQLALKLKGALPVVYSLRRMSSVARRAKNQFAENSKVAAKFDLLPEAGHNEVEAWGSYTRRLLPVIVHDSKESLEERAMFAAFKAVVRMATRLRPLEVKTKPYSALGRLLGPVLLLDYASVYLAFIQGKDPTPTLRIGQYRRLFSKLEK